MRRAYPLTALALTGCAVADARQTDRDATAEARLTTALAGLTPGRPMSCLPPGRSQSSLAAYGPVLVYTVSRSLKYVNRTTGGCENVARDDILVTRSPQGRLCAGDMAQTRTPLGAGGANFTGACTLGDFVEYRRTK